MSQDIKLIQDEFGQFDISVEKGDLAGVDGFDTAYWVSLFSDARASSSLVMKPENRRGWMGDLVSSVENRLYGGLIWLLDQRRLNQDTLNKAIDYTRDSLSWMIEDRVALNNTVTGTIIPRQGIQLKVETLATDGKTETRFFDLWKATGV